MSGPFHRHGACVLDASGLVIAALNASDADRDAHGDLFAAAPDLLAALEELPRERELLEEQRGLEEVRSHRDNCGHGNFGIAVQRDEEAIAWQALETERSALWKRRMAAIAKARGQS